MSVWWWNFYRAWSKNHCFISFLASKNPIQIQHYILISILQSLPTWYTFISQHYSPSIFCHNHLVCKILESQPKIWKNNIKQYCREMMLWISYKRDNFWEYHLFLHFWSTKKSLSMDGLFGSRDDGALFGEAGILVGSAYERIKWDHFQRGLIISKDQVRQSNTLRPIVFAYEYRLEYWRRFSPGI